MITRNVLAAVVVIVAMVATGSVDGAERLGRLRNRIEVFNVEDEHDVASSTTSSSNTKQHRHPHVKRHRGGGLIAEQESHNHSPKMPKVPEMNDLPDIPVNNEQQQHDNRQLKKAAKKRQATLPAEEESTMSMSMSMDMMLRVMDMSMSM